MYTYTSLELESKTFGELKKIGYELNVLPEGDRRLRQTWIDAIAGINPPLLQLLEVSPAASVEQVQTPIIETVETSPGVEVEPVQEPPLESKFGRIVYPRPAHGAISQVAKTSPGVEVDRVQDTINQTWTSWEKEHCAWLKDAKWCVYKGENKRIKAFLPLSKTIRLEGMRSGVEYCHIWEVSECTYGFDGNPLPVCSSLYSQESIEQATKTPPAVDVGSVEDLLPECSNCFGDGYIEDEFGSVKFCQCEPKLSRQKTQSAIAPAANISLHDEADRHPILRGIALSDRFLARYSPPQPEIEFNVGTDGQLNLLDFKVADEPPDPDDFESLDAFREAIAIWDDQNPEPPAVSIDSMCEWVPCPEEWYEPESEILPLKASSMMELPEQSEVSELSLNRKSSITLDFSIPTFDAWCDRPKGSHEPPDTGIFARLPKPKPPTFPPQASEPKSAQVSPASRNYPETIPRLSRNYPQTIPKLFRIVTGSSPQPARSPPGGDAM